MVDVISDQYSPLDIMETSEHIVFTKGSRKAQLSFAALNDIRSVNGLDAGLEAANVMIQELEVDYLAELDDLGNFKKVVTLSATEMNRIYRVVFSHRRPEWVPRRRHWHQRLLPRRANWQKEGF